MCFNRYATPLQMVPLETDLNVKLFSVLGSGLIECLQPVSLFWSFSRHFARTRFYWVFYLN